MITLPFNPSSRALPDALCADLQQCARLLALAGHTADEITAEVFRLAQTGGANLTPGDVDALVRGWLGPDGRAKE